MKITVEAKWRKGDLTLRDGSVIARVFYLKVARHWAMSVCVGPFVAFKTERAAKAAVLKALMGR